MPYELGLRRLREDFGLEPVEYPATRLMGSTPRQRADDLHAAFADPEIKAVISAIGGDDQITVLPLLDGELLRAHPKPFFGYSDNTNLLVALWNLGLVSYHGGSVMVQFGRPGAMHPVTERSLRAALFGAGEPFALTAPGEVGHVTGRWEDPATFAGPPVLEPAGGWTWHRPDRLVEGPSWGGNLEILSWLLMAGRGIREPAAYEGCVLFLETSEDLPRDTDVYWILRSMGERGLLRRFPAVLVGRPKCWHFDRPLGPAERSAYAERQQAAVRRALAEYAPDAMAVFDVDLGHTDPQQIVPHGGTVRVDGPNRTIEVVY
jgi:muramoyltetrapeptide carboxypeptidase LdcA involved in peptidoglycan recycling